VAFSIPGPKRINHLMIACENVDDVGLAYEIVPARKLQVPMGFGKNSNDPMYSFYVTNASGRLCEIGFGGRPATHQSEYHRRHIYGHEGQLGAAPSK